ncbi:MAG TPA: 3-oxoacyl-[acyl-carrier-protein] reductase [Clostridia bacterium]|nr:3-oxoacyl-[acyl-carrier-protein] reductase [Clostridia bacterium]
MLLEGKTAIVTGSSRGIGKAIALALAGEGARVVINYLENKESALEVIKEIEILGSVALAIKADVSQKSGAELLVEDTVKSFGKLDILVNNAGINRDSLLLRMSNEDWDSVLRTNLTGVFNCSRAALKPMIKERSGRIINISSVVGLVGNGGQTNYAAAKAGVIGFTKSLAKEVASRNILVNAVAPGFIETEMTAGLPARAREELKKTIPLGRFGCTGDVAGVVIFLASPAAGYITGQTITVDGGMVM